jgi:hypothetical protein
MSLAGAMHVALETADVQLWKDCNDCGTGCAPNGSARVLRARVTVPVVEGGYFPAGPAAWLWVSNDQPHDLPDGRGGTLVNLGGVDRLEIGRPTELIRDVPAEDQPYAPCFSLRVFDPAGHHVDAPALCMPRLDVKATIREIDSHGTGCAVASRPTSRPAPLLLLLVSLATAVLARRLVAAGGRRIIRRSKAESGS